MTFPQPFTRDVVAALSELFRLLTYHFGNPMLRWARGSCARGNFAPSRAKCVRGALMQRHPRDGGSGDKPVGHLGLLGSLGRVGQCLQVIFILSHRWRGAHAKAPRSLSHGWVSTLSMLSILSTLEQAFQGAWRAYRHRLLRKSHAETRSTRRTSAPPREVFLVAARRRCDEHLEHLERLEHAGQSRCAKRWPPWPPWPPWNFFQCLARVHRWPSQELGWPPLEHQPDVSEGFRRGASLTRRVGAESCMVIAVKACRCREGVARIESETPPTEVLS